MVRVSATKTCASQVLSRSRHPLEGSGVHFIESTRIISAGSWENKMGWWCVGSGVHEMQGEGGAAPGGQPPVRAVRVVSGERAALKRWRQ